MVDSYNLGTQPENSMVLLIGDSFIEGNSLVEDKDKRYSTLISDELQGSAFINGYGGGVSNEGITWLNSYLIDIVHLQYATLVFGMNERDLDIWKSNALQIMDILKNNITPVLVTQLHLVLMLQKHVPLIMLEQRLVEVLLWMIGLIQQ